ncbi:MAG: DUF4476 domain-containing protein [Bacteroidia bacterium]
MKTLISFLAFSIISHLGFSQVVVQQQTVTTTYQQAPGFQMQFNSWNPFAPNMQSQNVAWDPFTNSYIQNQQQPIYVDQFGNPIQNQQQPIYVDQFGNPIQNQQQPIYIDQFGNPIQNQQQPIYVDQFGNPIQNQQQIRYVDQFGNPIQNQQQVMYVDQFGNPIQNQQQIFYVDQFGNPINNLGQCGTILPTQYAPQQTNFSPVNGAFPMNQGSFSQVLNQLSSQSFESTKISLARQIMTSNWFTSEQIRQMMTQMTFEDSKVEIARSGYNRVVDPQNYFVVNSAFTFSSSVDELNRYLFGQ